MRSGAAAVVAAVIASGCVMVDDQLQVNLLGACRLPDGSVGVAQSRVTETTRGTCIYSFVLHAPPVALEQVEGALEAQRATLRSELATLKSLMEA